MRRTLHIQLDQIFGLPCASEQLDMQPNIRMKTDLVAYWKSKNGEAILQEFDGREGYIYQLELYIADTISLELKALSIDIHIMYILLANSALQLVDPIEAQSYTLDCERARFFYLPPRTYRLQVPKGRISFFGFYFQPKLFRDKNERPFSFLLPLIQAHRDNQPYSLGSVDFKVGNTTKNYIERLLRNVKKGDLDSEKYIIDTLINLIQLSRKKIFDEYERTSDPEELINRCRQRIAQQIADTSQPVILKSIAAQLHVSLEHLCRLHKKYYSITLLTYRDTLLMAKIKGLLPQPYNLLEISARCGFSDASSLIRFFKNKTGRTLGKYRNTLK